MKTENLEIKLALKACDDQIVQSAFLIRNSITGSPSLRAHAKNKDSAYDWCDKMHGKDNLFPYVEHEWSEGQFIPMLCIY